MDNSLIALGLMSGTSLDGVDASIIKSDGDNILEIIDNRYFSYPLNFKNRLSSFIEKITKKDDIYKNIDEYNSLEREITSYHSQISQDIIKKNSSEVQLIGFHGQTIIHKPKEGYSIQMGNAKLLSQNLKKKVIYNFRLNDIKNGGEGAPLTPIYHKLLSKLIYDDKPVLVLNIGGISNYTFCYKEKLYAKDIGPGNVLIDKYLKKTRDIYYDEDGNIAESGKINIDIVNQFYEHEFYNVGEKLSFDINEFDINFVKGLDFEDAVATLTYFTAFIISENIKKNIKHNPEIIICGGGRKNKTLINHLKKLLISKINLIDDFNFDGDFIESQAFAYLSIRSCLNKTLTFPTTTNVNKPVSGGLECNNF